MVPNYVTPVIVMMQVVEELEELQRFTCNGSLLRNKSNSELEMSV
nr:hypothetical protein [Brevibacillus laterosporus]